jgi:hypothetical protein
MVKYAPLLACGALGNPRSPSNILMRRNARLHCTKELQKLYPAEFYSWSLMWNRCANDKNPDWPAYGGRGISVEDDTWRDFTAFLEAVGERPVPKSAFCLARIDKTKGYFLKNVHWADRKETVENFNHYQRRQTHCQRGHLLGPGNQVRPESRSCLMCAKLTRRWRLQKKKNVESVHKSEHPLLVLRNTLSR